MRKAKTAKRLSSLLIVFVLLVSVFPVGVLAASADQFTDVSRDSWYYDYVDYVVDRGYFNGTSDTTFDPNDTMTRAMFVTVLARMDGAEVDNNTSVFSDVPTHTWYTGAVTWASENGIVEGIGNGRYEPNRAITREEMCVIMDRFIEYYGAEHNLTPKRNGSTAAFPDGKQIAAYAREAVANCRAYGLVEGYDDGYFHPQDNSTRAQVAAVIYRLAWLTIEATDDGNGGNRGNGGGGGGVSTKSSYTIIYYKNDGTGDEFDSRQTEEVASSSKRFTVIDTVPTREGYAFQGWNTESDGTGTSYTAGEEYRITGNLNLYAIWELETNPDDLVGNAVAQTVADANSKYEAMKDAVITALNELYESNESYQTVVTPQQFAAIKTEIKNMVTVGTVTYVQSETGPRPVSATVSVSVTEDQAVSAIEAATDLAEKLLNNVDDESVSTPSKKDVDSFIEGVKAIIKEKTDIDLTSERTEAIKTQVINKLTAEGKEEWVNFYDEGGYKCGDVTITANGCTVVIKVDDTAKTTTLGSVTDMNGNSVAATKTNAVKYLGEAIAKDMLNQVKKQSSGEYIDNTSMTGTVTVTFAKSETEEYANKQFNEDGTPIFPNEYEVSLTVNLDSDGIVLYKYENDTNYLAVAVSNNLKTAYDKSLSQISTSMMDPQMMTKLVEKIQSELSNSIPDNITSQIKTQLKNYGFDNIEVSDRNTIVSGMQAKVESWVKANIITLASYAGDTTNTDVLKGLDNAALTDVIWAPIKNQIDKEAIDVAIKNLVNKELENFDIVAIANSKLAVLGVQIDSINDVEKMLEEGGRAAEMIKTIAYNAAKEELETKVNESTGTLNELFGELEEEPVLDEEGSAVYDEDGNEQTYRPTEEYLIYSTLVNLGLTAFEPDADSYRDYALAELEEPIRPIAKNKVEGIISDKISSAIQSANITSIIGDDYEGMKDLAEDLVKVSSENVASVKLAEVANLLQNSFLQKRIGDTGDSYVADYLARIINRIPTAASITINDVELDKTSLSELAKATTTLEAMGAVAAILRTEGLKDLTLKDFSEEKGGVTVDINWNARTFSFQMVIDRAENLK